MHRLLSRLACVGAAVAAAAVVGCGANGGAGGTPAATTPATPPPAATSPAADVAVAEVRAEIAAQNPQGRIIQPEEIAAVIAFLIGDAARGITMEEIKVTGGALW